VERQHVVFEVSLLSKQSTVKLCLWMALSARSLHRNALSSVSFEYKLRKEKKQVKRDVIIDTDSDSNGCPPSGCVCVFLFVWCVWHV